MLLAFVSNLRMDRKFQHKKDVIYIYIYIIFPEKFGSTFFFAIYSPPIIIVLSICSYRSYSDVKPV
jgi:hypothetical protein